MIVTPLALHAPRAVRDALRAHGWDDGAAVTAAGGIDPAAFHIAGLAPDALEALVGFAARFGLELVTGDDWAVLAGSRARLSAFARPWGSPDPLQELVLQVGLALPAHPPAGWQTARGMLPLDRPLLAGILNVTPDSFSDGGRWTDPDAALAQAERLVADGAGLLDVGGESSAPGRTGRVPADEERARVVPVIRAVVRRFPKLVVSVDTVRAEVAAAALDAGAAVVNDVSGLRLDPGMAPVVARARAGLVVMHSRGGFEEMASYTHARYPDGVVAEVLRELRDAVGRAVDAGVAPEAVAVDPGLGFSKTVEDNILLLDQLAALGALGRPVLVGPSRKRFLGAVTGREVHQRDSVTAAACALAWERGARIFRVHDVAAARDALALAQAVGGG